MNATAPTFKQFAKAARDAVRSEYGISVADATSYYPDHLLRPLWMKSLISHAAAGGDISASVVRTMTDAEQYAVNKFGYSHCRFAGQPSGESHP